ncbi:hypothetical protein A0H81_06174 [Grifola frondosa]|uniref:Uncharacterized protein n=1 Tax=Grifola frondosa TaxID=5627 RepID=A0A1C7MGJ7_GRIFR|nr:hypothetical protein A0H81_06174 [Grifola frondosa]
MGSSPSGIQQSYNPYDARTRVAEAAEKRDGELAREKRVQELKDRPVAGRAAQSETSPLEVIFYVGSAFLIVMAVGLGAVWLLLKYIDA